MFNIIINTVKEQIDKDTNTLTGYLLNGEMYAPLADGNPEYEAIKEWIAAGNIPEPAFSLTDIQNFKIEELIKAFNDANKQDIAYMSTTFQADDVSQDRIAKVLSVGSVPTGFYWLDTVNNKVTMTYTDLQGLANEILLRSQANFDHLQTLKDQVRAATTEADVDVIVW